MNRGDKFSGAQELGERENGEGHGGAGSALRGRGGRWRREEGRGMELGFDPGDKGVWGLL